MNWSDTTFWTPDGYTAYVNSYFQLHELLTWIHEINEIWFNLFWKSRWHFYFLFKIHTFHHILARNKECIFKEHCGILCSLQNTLIHALVGKNGLHIISAILMLKLESQESCKSAWSNMASTSPTSSFTGLSPYIFYIFHFQRLWTSSVKKGHFYS